MKTNKLTRIKLSYTLPGHLQRTDYGRPRKWSQSKIEGVLWHFCFSWRLWLWNFLKCDLLAEISSVKKAAFHKQYTQRTGGCDLLELKIFAYKGDQKCDLPSNCDLLLKMDITFRKIVACTWFLEISMTTIQK